MYVKLLQAYCKTTPPGDGFIIKFTVIHFESAVCVLYVYVCILYVLYIYNVCVCMRVYIIALHV